MVTSVVFMGSAAFGIPVLQALAKDERFRVDLVVSNPAKPVGRKGELMLPPLGLEANFLDLPLVTPKTKQELTETLLGSDLNPDFLVVIAYGMIVPQAILDWPKVAPVYDFSRIELSGEELLPEVFADLSALAATDLPELLLEIKAKKIEAKEQVGEATYVGKIQKQDGQIDFNIETASQIFNKYRAYFGWPGVYFLVGDKRVLVNKMELVTLTLVDDLAVMAENYAVGQFFVVPRFADRIFVKTKDGLLALLLVKPEGMTERDAVTWFKSQSK
jgi:methionyl-tRNA formyltransferase